ncbi:N-acetylmuramic acid 6-phosphate etherase [Streptomyces sp. di188]|nr:N-acetylmuramic acid 6-phosphate etherase [Streptomyces sp. di50b]SCE42209.1 N-acetylmuramic acid 6-phosphate etherase [Streptomyces sp. di188]
MNAEDATVTTAVAARLPEIAAAIDGVTARMARGGRIVCAGAGTAGRLGTLDASECPPTFNTDPAQVVGLIAGGPTAVVSAVEGAEDREDAAREDLDALALTADDVAVGISAPGRTPCAVAAVGHARALGALTVGLSCNEDSALAAAADHGIEVVVVPETLTGSTRLKAGTAQKLVLNTITMIQLGKTYGNLMVGLRASNEKLKARAHRIVSLATGARDESVGTALADNDGEVKHSILTLLASVDAPTAARLPQDAHGHLRKALEAAAA